MAAIDDLARRARGVSSLLAKGIETVGSRVPSIYTPRVTTVSNWHDWYNEITTSIDGETPSTLFLSQPHLRTVVTFRARNMAQLGLHVFTRTENGRERDRDSIVSQTLAYVDGVMTTYELIFSLVGDLDLYDRAHWFVHAHDESPSGFKIRRIPPAWVTPHKWTHFEVLKWRVDLGDGQVLIVPKSNMLSFTGYSPSNTRAGSPTIESLRNTLKEQMEASLYRSQIWKRGGRVSSVLERPKDAPPWSDTARSQFREDWYAKFTGRGSGAGGTPILEDGMTLRRIDFNAQEQQFVEAARLALNTVASAYHVNPTMVGQLSEGTGYAAVREYRKMLYGDTLGPVAAQIEARINQYLVPMLEGDPRRTYTEFNIEEKLQGNFEDQADALSKATGRPWMTTNEARAARNLPRIEGGDVLMTPVNMAEAADGGEIEPEESPKALEVSGVKRTKPRHLKAGATDDDRKQAATRLIAFARRQSSVVRSRLGADRDDWWDQERWDEELTDEILAVYMSVSGATARATLAAAGIRQGEYDQQRTIRFLLESAQLEARGLNAANKASLDEAIAEADDKVEAAKETFEQVEQDRLLETAVTVTTFAAAFGTVEAAKQRSSESVKTWHSGPRSREQHQRLDGQTVGIDEVFSNGLKWPGAAQGPPEEFVNCQCSVSVDIVESE